MFHVLFPLSLMFASFFKRKGNFSCFSLTFPRLLQFSDTPTWILVPKDIAETWLSPEKRQFSNTKFNHKIIKLKGPSWSLSLTPLSPGIQVRVHQKTELTEEIKLEQETLYSLRQDNLKDESLLFYYPSSAKIGPSGESDYQILKCLLNILRFGVSPKEYKQLKYF